LVLDREPQLLAACQCPAILILELAFSMGTE
jgi:hypothetical protein